LVLARRVEVLLKIGELRLLKLPGLQALLKLSFSRGRELYELLRVLEVLCFVGRLRRRSSLFGKLLNEEQQKKLGLLDLQIGVPAESEYRSLLVRLKHVVQVLEVLVLQGLTRCDSLFAVEFEQRPQQAFRLLVVD